MLNGFLPERLMDFILLYTQIHTHATRKQKFITCRPILYKLTPMPLENKIYYM